MTTSINTTAARIAKLEQEIAALDPQSNGYATKLKIMTHRLDKMKAKLATEQAATPATAAATKTNEETTVPKTDDKMTPSKKATKTKAGKPKADKASPKATTEKPKKADLRKPQVRVLETLRKAGKGLTRKEIAAKGSVDLASLSGYIGSYDADRRAKDDEKMMSLLSLGYVRVEQHDEDGKDVVRTFITAKGTKALEKAAAGK